MNQAKDLIAQVAGLVDGRLDELIPPADERPQNLHSAIRWSVFAGGKRFRPALLVAVGRAFGAADHDLMTTAAAIEMIHTYSLIHDDLPSMDDDDLRRGRPTCHIQFGEATAILAGDALQSLAFGSIARDSSLDPAVRARLIALIAASSGAPNGMVAGQQMDLDAEGTNAGLDEIEAIHRRKTGALISASAIAGAVIGKADNDDILAVQQFSEHLGLLFQITDDVLDITQPSSSLGKTSGKDAAVRKATYPSVLGMEEAAAMSMRTAAAARRELKKLSRATTLLSELIDLIAERKN